MKKLIIKYETDWYNPGYPTERWIVWEGYRVYVYKKKCTFWQWLIGDVYESMHSIESKEDNLTIKQILKFTEVI